MDILHAVILGMVEGVTEFLPVSSTGHLILASKLLGLPETEFLKSFEISIQLGAILAVVALYWRKLLLDWEIMKRLIAAFMPTAVIGFLLYKTIKLWLGSETIVLWSLFLGGVALIVFELWHTERPDAHDDIATIPYRTAVILGLFQSIAMIPGVSRSGATIIGGLLLGLRRATIVEFSFLLAVPTMAAATGLDLFRHVSSFTAADGDALLAGFVVSFLVAWASIVWLLRFVRTHTFIPFGIYRIAIALFLFWWIA